MKKRNTLILIYLVLFLCVAFAAKPFRFALFTDTHISPTITQPTEDLINAVNDVNSLNDIDFVIVSGDVSDLGDTVSLKIARKQLEKLHMPYFILPGNHDIRWSEPQAANFKKIFQADKFSFTHKGYNFVGFATAPQAKSGKGIIRNEDIDWLQKTLDSTKNDVPVFAVTHYPLQTGDVENWKDATDVLKKHNIKAVLGGHYHRNVLFNYDGIPGIISRSALRAKDPVGGYSVFAVSDTIKVWEKRIGQKELLWLELPMEQ